MIGHINKKKKKGERGKNKKEKGKRKKEKGKRKMKDKPKIITPEIKF